MNVEQQYNVFNREKNIKTRYYVEDFAYAVCCIQQFAKTYTTLEGM